MVVKEFFYYVGITVIGIILYFIGNFLIGERNEGGKRMILAIVGIVSGVLGYFTISSYGDSLFHLKFPDGIFAVLGTVFLGLGVYLFVAALLASQKHIRKLFDGLLSGW
jgi:hypothetical protein